MSEAIDIDKLKSTIQQFLVVADMLARLTPTDLDDKTVALLGGILPLALQIVEQVVKFLEQIKK